MGCEAGVGGEAAAIGETVGTPISARVLAPVLVPIRYAPRSHRVPEHWLRVPRQERSHMAGGRPPGVAGARAAACLGSEEAQSTWNTELVRGNSSGAPPPEAR